MKELIWKLLPGFVRRAWSGSDTKNPAGWFGHYPDWQSASAQASGYDNQLILEKVRQSLRKVKRAEAAFERDSVAFSKADYQPEIIHWLKTIAVEKGKPFSVLDFGGSLGSSYFQYISQLRAGSVSRWTVVEQKHFVEAGRQEFEDGLLRFSPDAKDAMAGEKPGVLLLFSVLPYLPEPFRLLEELLALEPEYIIVDRTPVIGEKPSRITLQIVPEWIYKASYPAWFFNEKELLVTFGEKYALLAEFRSKFAAPYQLEDGTKAEWKGFVFKRR